MFRKFVTSASAAIVLALTAGAAQAVPLGSYNFDATKFGDSLIESDGGTFASVNWLSIFSSSPGNPGYLTGANFDSGIANIGISGPVSYTIGYSGGIANGAGADFGVVTARYSINDPITLEVSTDGVVFSSAIVYGPALGVATGVSQSYNYGGSGYSLANLFVTSIDLADFGIAAGSSIAAIRVTGTTELDLIRVAGFGNDSVVPEPATWAMMVMGFGVIGAALRGRRRTAVSFG